MTNKLSAQEIKDLTPDRDGVIKFTRENPVEFEPLELKGFTIEGEFALDYTATMSFGKEGDLQAANEDSFDRSFIYGEKGNLLLVTNIDPRIPKDMPEFADLKVGDYVLLRKGADIMRYHNHENIWENSKNYNKKYRYIVLAHDVIGVTRVKG